MTADGELARLRDELARRESELASSRREAANLMTELEETNRGLIALHAELEHARQAEAQLAAIVQSSDDAMYSLSLDGVVQTWNAGAERLLGYHADAIVGRPIETTIPEELVPQFATTFQRVATGEPAETFETRRRREDGSLVDVAVTFSPIRDAEGMIVGVSAVLRDITHRLEAEQELAATRAEREVLAERERIARDLHDHVIQRIFAAGMALEGASVLAAQPEVAERLDRVVRDLDATIADVRTTIFAIKRHRLQGDDSVRAKVLAVVNEARPALGFAPAVRFHGPIDIAVPHAVVSDAVAVVRESLSNIARHADASTASVTVTAADDLVIEVDDDGRGLGESTRRSGLANLRERAEMLGGSFEVTSSAGDGTRLCWRVPLAR